MFADVNDARTGWRTAIVVRGREDVLGKLLVELAKSHDVAVDEAQGWLRTFDPEIDDGGQSLSG